MSHPIFRSYHPFGTLTDLSSPISNYSIDSNSPYLTHRLSSSTSGDELNNNNDNIEHISEDEFDALTDGNNPWPSVLAPSKFDPAVGSSDLTGYSSTVPWALSSSWSSFLYADGIPRSQSIVSISPRRESAGAADMMRRSSLNKVWNPENSSPEEDRRNSTPHYGQTQTQTQLHQLHHHHQHQQGRRPSATRLFNVARSNRLLEQAARRRSSAISSGSYRSAISLNSEEVEQVRRIRSMDLLGRRFSEAVYIEETVMEPVSPGTESSSEEEEERDWTPDLHAKVNAWSPETSSDTEDESDVDSPALATPDFRPLPVIRPTELSNFPLTSVATHLPYLSPNLHSYIAPDESPNGPVVAVASGSGSGSNIQGWNFPSHLTAEIRPSQYLLPALPASSTNASLRISSTIRETYPTIPQSSFKRSASSPLFGARNGDLEAFSKKRSGNKAESSSKRLSLRTMAPMQGRKSSIPREYRRPSLARSLSEEQREQEEAAVEKAVIRSEDEAEGSIAMSRKPSLADEVQAFGFMAAEITVQMDDDGSGGGGGPIADYAFPGPATPRAQKPSTGITRLNAPGPFTLPSFPSAWLTPLSTPGGLTPRYNPMDSFLGKTTPVPSSASPNSQQSSRSPSTPLIKSTTSPLMPVEAQYKEEPVVIATPSTPETGKPRPRSGQQSTSPPRGFDQAPAWRTSWEPKTVSNPITEPAIVRHVSSPVRKAVPKYDLESPVLPTTVEPFFTSPKQSSSRHASSSSSRKCKRCEEKAAAKALASQALSPATAHSGSSEESKVKSHSHHGHRHHHHHHHHHACSCYDGIPRHESTTRSPSSRQISASFPQPPARESPPQYVVRPVTPPPAPSPSLRVTHARTPSPKRLKQIERENREREQADRAAMIQGMRISSPVLITTTSQRPEIPLNARGSPMTTEMLRNGSTPTASRPAPRHHLGKGSFPQDPDSTERNPNTAPIRPPRPDLRRSASAADFAATEPNHKAASGSRSGFIQFLKGLPVPHGKSAQHGVESSPDSNGSGSSGSGSSTEQVRPGFARHHTHTSSASSSGSGSGSGSIYPGVGNNTRPNHRRQNSSVSSSNTIVSSSTHSRPMSSSSTGSDRTLVDFKESFKLFAASAKGKKVLHEEPEWEEGFEGQEPEEILLTAEQSRMQALAKMQVRRPRPQRYSSMMF